MLVAMVTYAMLRKAEAIVVGVICNRGGVSAADLDVAEFHALVNVNLESWEAQDCHLCKEGVAINTQLGKGRK